MYIVIRSGLLRNRKNQNDELRSGNSMLSVHHDFIERYVNNFHSHIVSIWEIHLCKS